MEERLKLKYPVIVEGKYDKAKVCLAVSTPVIALDGFSIFNNIEKQQLLKRLARGEGVILLTDSDRAGNFIRSKLKGILKGKYHFKKEKSPDILRISGLVSTKTKLCP